MSKKIARPYKLCTKEEGQMNGEPKTFWNQIGSATIFSDRPLPEDTSILIKISHMPNVKISAFPFEKRDDKDAQQTTY